MTAIPLVLKGLPVTEPAAMLKAIDVADQILRRADGRRVDHVDRFARWMEAPRITWTAGGDRVRTWTEAHPFQTNVVADGLWVEVTSGGSTFRIVEMLRSDRSNSITRTTSAEGLRCILSQIGSPLRCAADIDPDLMVRPPLENDVILPDHLDALTEAGTSTTAGMLAVILDVPTEMIIQVVTGRPYGPIVIGGLREADDASKREAERRLARLVPAQIELSVHQWDGIRTWQMGPRSMPPRLHDVRLSTADALRIAGSIR